MRSYKLTAYSCGLMTGEMVVTKSQMRGEGYPKFSIVMPSRNSVKFIERSILSVLEQGYPNLELIIIDGGSEDGTGSVIERYTDRISYWVSESDNGQSEALNKGFLKATGDIYGWLNADDIYCRGAFETAAEIFARSLNKDVVYGDWLSIDERDQILFRHIALPPSLPRLIADGFQFNLQAAFWRGHLHKQLSGFDIRLHRTMDYDFALELLERVPVRRIQVVKVPLGGFRRHPEQKTKGFDETVCAEQRLISRKHQIEWKYSWRVYPVKGYSKCVKLATWIQRGALHEIWRAITGKSGRVKALISAFSARFVGDGS